MNSGKPLANEPITNNQATDNNNYTELYFPSIDTLRRIAKACQAEGILMIKPSTFGVNYTSISQYLPFKQEKTRGLFFRLGMSPLTLLQIDEDELKTFYGRKYFEPLVLQKISPEKLDAEGVKFLSQFNSAVVYSITSCTVRFLQQLLRERGLNLTLTNGIVQECNFDYHKIKNFIEKYCDEPMLPTFTRVSVLPSIFTAAKFGTEEKPLWETQETQKIDQAQPIQDGTQITEIEEQKSQIEEKTTQDETLNSPSHKRARLG